LADDKALKRAAEGKQCSSNHCTRDVLY